MPGQNWCFTDDDRARLQPLLDRMLRRANYAVARCCELAVSVDDRLLLLQGACEQIADWLREEILLQVDHGEWSARGINRREEVSITVGVDAQAAYYSNANLVRLAMMPVEYLS